jgi:hypothetical protein
VGVGVHGCLGILMHANTLGGCLGMIMHISMLTMHNGVAARCCGRLGPAN